MVVSRVHPCVRYMRFCVLPRHHSVLGVPERDAPPHFCGTSLRGVVRQLRAVVRQVRDWVRPVHRMVRSSRGSVIKVRRVVWPARRRGGAPSGKSAETAQGCTLSADSAAVVSRVVAVVYRCLFGCSRLYIHVFLLAGFGPARYRVTIALAAEFTSSSLGREAEKLPTGGV